jgi:uncharacterized protein (DUF2236 family)
MLGSLLHRLGVDLPPMEPGVPGDPGLFGPSSIVWAIGRERVLLLGGSAALLMQIAHPLVAAAVSRHSAFREDPFARLRATLDATLRITFGDRRQAERAAQVVRATHSRVRGTIPSRVGPHPAGATYDPADPDLALWVHATLVITAVEVYSLLVRPLSTAERDLYHRQGAVFARLFGVDSSLLPQSYEEFLRYFRRTVASDLAVGADARSLAGAILAPPVPAVLRPARRVIRAATATLLPPEVVAAFGLEAPRRRATAAAAAASRRALPLLPGPLRFWPHYQVAVGRVHGPSHRLRSA